MHPSFEQFVAALRDPQLRPGIGLVIGDADAAALLTNTDWANDYYAKWIALFPASGSTPAVAAASDPFGPPPAAAPLPTQEFTWDAAPARRGIPTGARLPLIIGGSVLALVVLGVVGVSVVSAAMVAGSIQHPVTSSHASSAPTASAVALPEDLHGLTGRQYRLMEIVVESEGHTIPELAAKGLTDERLHSLSDTVVAESDKACSETAKYADGFDNVTFKASFIAGYAASAKVTPDKAAVVYAGIADYCAAG